MNKFKGIIKNRSDAAIRLKEVLPKNCLKDEKWKMIAVSKGGLELVSYLRGRNSNEIDFLFSQPVPAPNNHECEIARVSEFEEIVINEHLVNSFEIQYDYIYGEAHRRHEEEILSQIYQYRKGRPFTNVQGEVVLLVDEGSETGMKFMTALKTILSMKPKAVYIAVPVLPSDVLETLEPFTDEIFFLHNIDDYVQTSLYYEELEPVSDERIEMLLLNKKVDK